MAQRIKVQDGRIVYESTDTSYDISMDVKGQMNVTKELNVGDDPLADGIISTPDNSPVDLIITTNTDGISSGNLRLQPLGNIILNNVAWPPASETPVPGMFLGVSSLNNLGFYSFALSPLAPNDNLSEIDLNILYPTATIGQFAIGPNVLYFCIGSGEWRTSAAGSADSTVPYYIPLGETYTVNTNRQALYHLPIDVDGDLVIDGFLVEV